MKRQRNKKGFTLAELLIVVAIIAVLVAISIPIFTRQLEKSREGTDLANVRAAYAEVMVAAMEENKTITYSMDKATIYQGDDSYAATVQLVQESDGWITEASSLEIGGIPSTDQAHWHGQPTAKGKCTVVFDGTSAHFYWSGSSGGDATPTIPDATPTEPEQAGGNTAPSYNDLITNAIVYPGMPKGDETFDFIQGRLYLVDGKTMVYIDGNTQANQYYSPVGNHGQAFVEISSNSQILTEADYNQNKTYTPGDLFRDSNGDYYIRPYDNYQTYWGLPSQDSNWMKINLN